jgi:hypothetical protein
MVDVRDDAEVADALRGDHGAEVYRARCGRVYGALVRDDVAPCFLDGGAPT